MAEAGPCPLPPLLGGLDALLPEAEREGFARLRRAWHARLAPIDEAERAIVDQIATQAWRASRLDALEERVTAALLDGRPDPGLPTLATIARLRARLERDCKAAFGLLHVARTGRPSPLVAKGLSPARLAWLARYVARKAAEAEDAGLPLREAPLDLEGAEGAALAPERGARSAGTAAPVGTAAGSPASREPAGSAATERHPVGAAGARPAAAGPCAAAVAAAPSSPRG